MAGKNPTSVDAQLRAARIALDSGDVADARGRLQRAMTLLSVNPDHVYVGTKMREIRRIEAMIRSPQRARTKQASAAARPPVLVPAPRSPSSTWLRELGGRADAIERLLQQARLADAKLSLDALRRKAQALDTSSNAARAVRLRAAELQSKLSKLEARRDKRKATGTGLSVTVNGALKTKAPGRGVVKKTQGSAASFVCDQCKKPRPIDEAVRKPGKRRVCVLCATGQVCPSCHRSKSPDFDLCMRCSGGGGYVKIVFGGAFESSRRKH